MIAATPALHVAWEVGRDSWPEFIFPSLVFIALVTGGVRTIVEPKSIWRERAGEPWTIVATWLLLIFLSSVFVLMSWNTIATYREFTAALRANRCTSVEGVVERLRSSERHEQFDLGGVHFSYSRFIENGGFHYPRRHVVDGAYIRICYLPRDAYEAQNIILRLEVAN